MESNKNQAGQSELQVLAELKKIWIPNMKVKGDCPSDTQQLRMKDNHKLWKKICPQRAQLQNSSNIE